MGVDTNASTKNKLKVDYVFTDAENQLLTNKFLELKCNPYEDYTSFRSEIENIVENDVEIKDIVEKIKAVGNRIWKEEPYLYLQNCPIDKDVPIFDHESPVQSKRELKKTYVGEGFLQFYAQVMEMPAIGYINVNDGDVFQDIYPMKSLSETQSQKALVALGFHKDLANHFVRPDFVNMLSMRAYEGNQIFTTFVKNIDLIQKLDPSDLNLMRQELFYTPFDDLSTYGNRTELGRAKNHAILLNEEEFDIAYFENRTVGLTEEAQGVVDKIKVLLHELKAPHLLKAGEFISLSNNHSIHGKDVEEITDVEKQRTRWIMKTVNLWSLEEHKEHYVDGTDCIVNG
ncbi:hypothetical protein ACQKM1_12905 [Peribacillus frigoritolerans]|uniref:hypothetical protein n=1 Tax=Peribacillus frigoritolerans TaxID=450367 RepID=UPI003D06B4E8